MRPVRWNIITQIVKKYACDTLIPTILLKNVTFWSSKDLHHIYIYIYHICNGKGKASNISDSNILKVIEGNWNGRQLLLCLV